MNITGQRPGLTEIQALQRFDLGERQPPAEQARDDHDLPQLMRLRERANQFVRGRSQDDLALHALTLSPMALEISSHLGNQQRYDHAVGLDRAGLLSFTQRRSALLRGIPGAQAIAAQFGQSFSPDLDDEPFYPRLGIANEDDVSYLRTEQSPDLYQALKSLYTHRHGALPAGYEVEFVNSRHALGYLRSQVAATSPPPQQIARGIIALPHTLASASNIDYLIGLLGARTSSYQVRRVLCGNIPSVPVAQGIDNHQFIKPLMPSRPESPSRRLRLASPTEGTGALAHTAASILDDLCTVLVNSGRLDEHRHNPLLAHGLVGLRKRMEDLNAQHNDTGRFGNAYRAMMEELYIVLAATRPYAEGHFKLAALQQLAKRLDPALAARLKKPEVYLATSGLNAILQGLEVAEQFSGDRSATLLSTPRHGASPLYYEAEGLLRLRGQKRTQSSRTLLATLNNSYPEATDRHEAPWDVDAVVEAARSEVARYKAGEPPFVLVLDTTVEHQADMRRLTSALVHELTSGKLQIAVCKSYQKYSNLCSAKVMAGCITLLGTDSPRRQQVDDQLRRVEQSYGLMANDESQLMTHFVRSGDHEFRLLERAMANAAFVRDTCFTGEGEHTALEGYHRHLPFAMMSMHSGDDDDFIGPQLHIRDHKGDLTSSDYLSTENIDSQRIRSRSSFAFSETTQSEIPDVKGYGSNVIRVAFGQESKAELTEMFYMASRLMHPEGSEFSPMAAWDHVNELVRAALTPAQRRATAEKTLAYKLALVGANQPLQLDDTLRLTGSVASMRRALEGQNVQQAFTLNKVASVIGQLGFLTADRNLMAQLAGSADREIVNLLLDGLIGSNMPGVSPMGRETVAHFHASLCEADMHAADPARRQNGLERLLDGLARIKQASSRGAYVDIVPDAVFKEQPAALRQRVLDLVFRPLSGEARLALVFRQLKSKQLSFAESCMDMLEHEDAGRDPNVANIVAKGRATLMQMRVQTQR